jgi:hypothetical protein
VVVVWWWFTLLVCWFVVVWSVLHFLFSFINNSLRLSCFFCCVLKVGTGYTFFPGNPGEILAYYLHAKTIFRFQFFDFHPAFFHFHFSIFPGPIKLMPGYELLAGGVGG